MKTYTTVPRVVSVFPMGFTAIDDEEIPVRFRDDLDPCAPPMEYANGRISWSGYATRDLRDDGRARKAQASAVEAQREAIAKARRHSEEATRLVNWTWAKIRAGVEFARSGEVHGFCCAVSRDENRRAHGNVCVTEHANVPFVIRSVNVNGMHREEGDWRPDLRAIDNHIAL